MYVLENICKYMHLNKMLPGIVFVFSRKKVVQYAASLQHNFLEEGKASIVKREICAILQRLPNYQEYINLIIGVFSSIKLKNTNQNTDIIEDLYKFYKKYILYASPKVISAFSDYFQFLYTQNDTKKMDMKKHLSCMTKVMLEMRKDL